MKRTAALVAAVATAGTLSATTLAATPAAAAACSVSWGSTDKAAGDLSAARLTNIRAGRHACFDRMVVDFRGKIRGYHVEYDTAEEPGSGAVVPLRGRDMHVEVLAAAYDDRGPTYDPARDREAVDVSGFRTFRQVAWVGSFEGQSTIGLGVRARLPFRVQIADGPGTGSRLVIDVAHTW